MFEYAAGVSLPAASPSYVQLVEHELLAVARVVTHPPTLSDVSAAVAGIRSVCARRKVTTARILCRALALPPGDPLRIVAGGERPKAPERH